MPSSALDLTLGMESDRMRHLHGAIDQKVQEENIAKMTGVRRATLQDHVPQASHI